MDLMFEMYVIEKKYKWRIDLQFDDAVLSQQQVQPTNQQATCRVNALLPANHIQALLKENATAFPYRNWTLFFPDLRRVDTSLASVRAPNHSGAQR